MVPNIGLTDSQREDIFTLLNTYLANENLLYIKVRNYHWNVKGPHFRDLHLFFEELYEELEEVIDTLAERVQQLGGNAIGTMAEYSKLSKLKEEPNVYPFAQNMVGKLLFDYEFMVRELREGVDFCDSNGDKGTSDLLTTLMEQHEKRAWMLRSTLTNIKLANPE